MTHEARRPFVDGRKPAKQKTKKFENPKRTSTVDFIVFKPIDTYALGPDRIDDDPTRLSIVTARARVCVNCHGASKSNSSTVVIILDV